MRYNSIDALKGFAILSVLLLHGLKSQILYDSYARFHIWQAMPIFMILLGVTLGLSISTPFIFIQYIKSKFYRIILPFLILFIISLLYGEYIIGSVDIGLGSFIGILPVSGSGNYFITLMFQFIIISPILLYLYRKHPQQTILIMISINIMYEYAFNDYRYNYLYAAFIGKWIAYIGMGLYISKYMVNNKQIYINWYLKMWFVISFIYIMYEPIDFQRVISIGYPLVFIILAINYNISNKWMEYIGKRSYEIFLAQIMIFR